MTCTRMRETMFELLLVLLVSVSLLDCTDGFSLKQPSVRASLAKIVNLRGGSDGSNDSRSSSNRSGSRSSSKKSTASRNVVSSESLLSDYTSGQNRAWQAEKTFATLRPAYIQPLQGQNPPYQLSLTPASASPKSSYYASGITAQSWYFEGPSSAQAISALRLPPRRRWFGCCRESLSALLPNVGRLELALFLTYACSIVAITTPTVLLPVIAADPSSHILHAAASAPTMSESAAFVARVASLSTLGGAAGKFVNGFVVSGVGGRTAARIYLVGLAAFSFLLSTTTSLHGGALAGMEFFASIMWTACTVIVASAYENNPDKFGKGILALSLASTLGSLLTKIAGSVLLKVMHWRQVSQVGAVIALAGAGVVHTLLRDRDCMKESDRRRAAIRERAGLKPAKKDSNQVTVRGIASSLGHVVGNKLFWLVGLAHAMAFLARRSDQLLGSFFRATSDLPSYLCGGLTSSVTLGFVHGLMAGKKFQRLELESDKKRYVKNGYRYAAVSALGLALCANPLIGAFLGKSFTAAAIAMASGAMASSISMQFYHLPALTAKLFGKNKAICVSFLDGMGFLLGAPIWYGVGRIISTRGWAAAWIVIAGFLSLGGVIMTKALPSVMEFKEEEAD
mmetsp:Transcript_31993/g.70325  ORF Transcript_31993/g.70325 Transcript_31993/m.70325 type:complete len:624 (+) Transcript_31993:124-1995(+)